MTTYAPYCDDPRTGYLLLHRGAFIEMDGSRFKRALRPDWVQVDLAGLQAAQAAFHARRRAVSVGGIREYSERLNDGPGEKQT